MRGEGRSGLRGGGRRRKEKHKRRIKNDERKKERNSSTLAKRKLWMKSREKKYHENQYEGEKKRKIFIV